MTKNKITVSRGKEGGLKKEGKEGEKERREKKKEEEGGKKEEREGRKVFVRNLWMIHTSGRHQWSHRVTPYFV